MDRCPVCSCLEPGSHQLSPQQWAGAVCLIVFVVLLPSLGLAMLLEPKTEDAQGLLCESAQRKGSGCFQGCLAWGECDLGALGRSYPSSLGEAAPSTHSQRLVLAALIIFIKQFFKLCPHTLAAELCCAIAQVFRTNPGHPAQLGLSIWDSSVGQAPCCRLNPDPS